MKYLDEKPSTSSLKPNMFKLNGILSPSLHYLFFVSVFAISASSYFAP
jgi:hypothetical protein